MDKKLPLHEREAASLTFSGASKNFKSNRAAVSKSGLNHTQDGQNERINEQRSGLSHNRSSMKNGRAEFDSKKIQENSELLKQSGS